MDRTVDLRERCTNCPRCRHDYYPARSRCERCGNPQCPWCGYCAGCAALDLLERTEEQAIERAVSGEQP